MFLKITALVSRIAPLGRLYCCLIEIWVPEGLWFLLGEGVA